MKSLYNDMSETTSKQTKVRIRLWHKVAFIFLGLFIALILIEAGLRISGFILLSLQEYRNLLSIKQRGEYRIICFGESTTQNQYPAFLEEILNQRNIGIKFSVIDKGIGGTNTAYILNRLEYNLNAYHPDMVITMMGSNDRGPHIPYEAVSDSQAIIFFKSFRTYKLARLLWLHIVTRLKELRFDKLSKHTAQPKFSLQRNELLKAIELNPENYLAYFGLGWFYRSQGKLSEAEALFKKAIELNPENDWAYIALKVIYIAMGNSRLAREYDKKAQELKLTYYLPITTANYNKLKAILDRRGIVYVCVQYPMRNMEPLKKIFQGNLEGMIFVDNEGIFKEAIEKEGYEEYFVDMCGGDFGHCTDKGNRLLAENIANVILEECFLKSKIKVVSQSHQN